MSAGLSLNNSNTSNFIDSAMLSSLFAAAACHIIKDRVISARHTALAVLLVKIKDMANEKRTHPASKGCEGRMYFTSSSQLLLQQLAAQLGSVL